MTKPIWPDEVEAKRKAKAKPPTVPGFRALRSRSYLTAVTILDGNLKLVLGNRRLELNEMTGLPELGRRPLRDTDEAQIRADIERLFVGGEDKHGNEIGLQLSGTDIHEACCQVAAANAYHPVRVYLGDLAWDGVDRIDFLPDLLGAERSELNQALLRRTLISAVARALKPGCQVHTSCVLVGGQGVFKSTFWRILGGDWFSDTPISLSKVPDCFQILRAAWIYEWAELETLKRASRSSEVKSFMSSAWDNYRPSYGRNAISVPRSGIVVGTTNENEFLADETGARRFWPVPVTIVDKVALAEQREQLWAEAVASYLRHEKWWIDNDEPIAAALNGVHDHYGTRDAWERTILEWCKGRSEVSVDDILGHALDKPVGTWDRNDQMRVASVLRRAGWVRRKVMGRIRWSEPEALS